MITSVEEMIEKYVNAWNNNGLDEFKAAFTECWAEDATYTDPNFDLKGVDAVAELALLSLKQYPDRKFHVLTTPEHHHHVGRYTWKVVNLPGNESREGFDCFDFNDEFKITRIVTFL